MHHQGSPCFKFVLLSILTFFFLDLCFFFFFFFNPRPYGSLFCHLPSHELHSGYSPSSPDLLYCTSFQALLAASVFSNGALEGLEEWYEAHQDHTLSFRGPGD